MEIRDAAPGDLQAVRRLLAACALPQRDLTPAHLEHFLAAVAPAEHRPGRVAGVVGVEPRGGGADAALLRSLAVAPAHRGSGAGARLVEAAEKRACQAGAKALYLLTTTAAAYFSRRGYERVPRAELPPAIQETEEATRLCPASAACMRKPLPRANAGE